MGVAKTNKNERTSSTDFVKTLKSSFLASPSRNWVTSSNLSHPDLQHEPAAFLGVISHLLVNPNLISTNVFRADILYDSTGELQTPGDKERDIVVDGPEPKISAGPSADPNDYDCLPPTLFQDFVLKRTVVRRFVPRNPNIDRSLDQTCHFYESLSASEDDSNASKRISLVTFISHLSSEEEIPFYHPAVRALAYVYEFTPPAGKDLNGPGYTNGIGTMSLHFQPFTSGIPKSMPNRLHRTLLNLLATNVRLTRASSRMPNPGGSNPRPFKDNLIPQHIVQDTYTKLKAKYASTLIRDWVEVTDPTKHVFEDIAIAAFLIELWKQMYKISTPAVQRDEINSKHSGSNEHPFPGFVDIACGNGVLVYILHLEGYNGYGFDARRRKTWSIFPPSVQERLEENICIPQPFKDALLPQSQPPDTENTTPNDSNTLSGIFDKDTFIISNHADELTLWTPLLGILSNPNNPLPFLAIPCCSHGISGARYRYPPPKQTTSSKATQTPHVPPREPQPPSNGDDQCNGHNQDEEDPQNYNTQPSTGDLKALRSSKLEAQQNPGSHSTTYGCLTTKVISIAEEMGYDVEKTALRIPSTRNIGIVGGLKLWERYLGEKNGSRRHGADAASSSTSVSVNASTSQDTATVRTGLTTSNDSNGDGRDLYDVKRKVRDIVERESMRDGGLDKAAKMWVERSTGLQRGQGKNKGG